MKWLGYAKPTWHPLVDFQDTIALEAFKQKQKKNLEDKKEDNVTGCSSAQSRQKPRLKNRGVEPDLN